MLKPVSSIFMGTAIRSLAHGDLNGDGKLDLLVANTSGYAYILLGDGLGGFQNFASLPPNSGALYSAALGDVNGDGRLDLALGAASSVTLRLGLGNGTFGLPIEIGGVSAPKVRLADMDGDGHVDVVASESGDPRVLVYRGDGAGGLAAAETYAVGTSPSDLVLGDLDGDGDVDVAVTNTASNSVQAVLNDGSGVLAAAGTTAAGSLPLSIAGGDVDGDGDRDLVAANLDANTVSVLINNGSGVFLQDGVHAVHSAPLDVALADMDGDGDLDLLVATSGGAVEVLSGDGSGGFAAARAFTTNGSFLREMTVGDFNADGRPDVAVLNAATGDVVALLTTALRIAADAPQDRAEGDAGAASYTFTVTRFGLLTGAVSAEWAVTGLGASAADAADFVGGVLPTGTVTFIDGQRTATITVNVSGDSALEATEGFRVTLSNPVGIDIEAGAATASIVDDDTPPPSAVVPRLAPVLGGEGDDSAFLSADGDVYSGAGGSDLIHGRDGSDTLHGNTGNDEVYGGSGADLLYGGKDDDVLDGGMGDDILYGDLGDDRLSGAWGRDVMQGGAGNDALDGGDEADTVRGGQGDDAIQGGGGDDWLSGDLGSDTLTGGAGADTFHSFAGAGLDRIADFSRAEGDRLQLDPGTTYALAQVGADTVVNLGGGGQVVLANVQLSGLTDDWIFGA